MNHVGMAAQSCVVGVDARPCMHAGPEKLVSGQVCAMVAVDIAGFTRPDRDHEVLMYLRKALYGMLKEAFDYSGISWTACSWEDRGDGVLIVAPPDVPCSSIVDSLRAQLRDLLRVHNRMSSSPARIQLRAAAHVGPVIHDGHGFVSRDINLLFRMLEARLLKRALADSGAELVLIVSDLVHQSLVMRHHPSPVSPEVFRRVRVQVKKTRISAWACLPQMASQDSRYDIDQAITAFRIALARMDANPEEMALIRNLADATDAQMEARAPLAAPPF